jgi:hypothetical protein
MPLGQASHTAKRKWLDALPTIGRMRLALSAISIALTIAGCSSYATPDKSASIQNKSIRDGSTAHQTAVANPPSGTHGSHRALVAARSAPNCELGEPEPDTIDADLWARLRLDYERQCYKQAEMLARKRLRKLLASGQCGDTASSRSPAFRHNYAAVR